MKNECAYIVVDFDGTVVEHDFPRVGADVPGAVDVLKALTKGGHKLILFTMRCPKSAVYGDTLAPAVQWFADRGIPLHGVQANPDQASWTTSPKAYGQVIIDDAALGCPLTHPCDGGRPHVDWRRVMAGLITLGLLDK